MLRSRSFTQPHPLLLRAVGSEASTIKLAKTGRPFLLAGPAEIALARAELIRRTMRESGFTEAHIDRAFAQSWVWQHVVVAESDREAHERGMAQMEHVHAVSQQAQQAQQQAAQQAMQQASTQQNPQKV